MIKRNWRFKRSVNTLLYCLRRYPRLVKILTKCVWFARYCLRGFTSPRADTAGGILINEQYKLVHLANPKVASSSMKQYFQNCLPDSKLHIGSPVSQIESLVEGDVEQYHYFTIVRNSWERVYSCWKDKISNQGKFADIFIISRYKNLYPDMPFYEFVDWLCSDNEGSDRFADRHWISQHLVLDENTTAIESRETIDLNDLTEAFQRLVNAHQLPVQQLHESNKSSGFIVSSFDAETIAKISFRYAKDIELYHFTPPSIKKEA